MTTNRRNKLQNQLSDNEFILLYSGKAPHMIADEYYPFEVNRNFYYLTNIDEENIFLLISKNDTYIFIEEDDEFIAKWVGHKISPVAVYDKSGIDRIIYRKDMMDTLNQIFTNPKYEQVIVYSDFCYLNETIETSILKQTICKLQEVHPHLVIHNATKKMASLRLIKDESEIADLRQAINITKEAIYYMMKNTHSGMYEYEIEAYFDFILKSYNAKHSFPSIIASGKNATIMHYSQNNTKTKNNQLLLCDLGARYNYMNADITRTYPINGKFTKKQRLIYDIVLKANRYIIALIKPGVTIRDLNKALNEFYLEELSSNNLLPKGLDIQELSCHGVSHMLGLETHDINIGSDMPLVAGNVLTVEPGLYFEDERIGIRIEDDILITNDGNINLSEGIIKDIDEIESMMQ